jgi:hypothetical protein
MFKTCRAEKHSAFRRMLSHSAEGAAGKARPTVNHLTVMKYVKLDNGQFQLAFTPPFQ